MAPGDTVAGKQRLDKVLVDKGRAESADLADLADLADPAGPAGQ